MTGVIKSINADKGFFFILGEDKKTYFGHRSALKNCDIAELAKGREVQFEDVDAEKGPRAEDIYV
jgi:CspA family cold shock protein